MIYQLDIIILSSGDDARSEQETRLDSLQLNKLQKSKQVNRKYKKRTILKNCQLHFACKKVRDGGFFEREMINRMRGGGAGVCVLQQSVTQFLNAFFSVK